MQISLYLVACALAFSMKGDDGKLTGVITDDAGKPIKGALVLIDSAGPKVGVGYLCPGCYKDCGKTAKTDDQGRYSLEKLDADFRFRLLVAAEGFIPHMTAKGLDPLQQAETIRLKPSHLENRDPSLIVRGKVVNEKGEPVENAILTPRGRKIGRGIQFGGTDDIDQLASTNAKGEFAIAVPTKDCELLLTVKARNLATTVSPMLPPGKSDNVVKMVTGVTVVGKVTKSGKPIPNFALGIAPIDRSARTYTGDEKIESDQNGEFRFVNIPPAVAYTVYGLTQSSNKIGNVRSRDVEIGPSGTTFNVGSLAITQGYSLTGRVTLPNGKPVPAGTPIVVGRDDAWDHKKTVTDADGSFEFQGLPSERIRLVVVLKGYLVAHDQPGVDQMSPNSARINLNKDIMGYQLRMEPETSERMAVASGQMRGRPTDRIPPRVRVKETIPLEEALADFNKQAARHYIGESQPPVTEDEVVAVIRGWDLQRNPLAPELRPLFQAIVDSRELPTGASLHATANANTANFRLECWQVSIGLPVPESVRAAESKIPRYATLMIRSQMIHSKRMPKVEMEMQQRQESRARAEEAARSRAFKAWKEKQEQSKSADKPAKSVTKEKLGGN